MKRCVSTVLLVSIFLLAVPTSAQESLRVGARVGGNWSLLTKPNDPAGEPTLNAGAAYTGWGFEGGLSVLVPFQAPTASGWFFGLDLLLSKHNSSGTVDIPANQQTRVTELQTSVFRLPLHGGYTYQFGELALRLSAGPELLMGIGSGATVTETNVPGTPDPLNTTPVTHVGLTVVLGMDYALPDWVIPVEFRFTYDPMVPASTKDRFDGFEADGNPGNFQVAHDVQFMFMIGVDYLLGLEPDE